MRVSYGKSQFLELKLMPLTSEVRRGIRVFEPADKNSARAAVIANRAVRFNFEKSVPSYASADERREIDAAKVDAAVFRDPSGAMRVVYREVIVHFEAASSAEKRKAVLDKFGLEIRKRNPLNGDQVIAFDPRRKYIAERVIELANELTATDTIAFAFPNFVSEFRRQAVPQPIAAQWHLTAIRIRNAWKKSEGKGITIAILDDGIDIDHPNLKSNIRLNPDPDDPNDLHGRDYYVGEDGGPEYYDPRPKRFQSPFDETELNDIHGTPCAGVAAASGKIGNVFGAAPRAKILPVKIFHASALASESNVANAIRYASRFADILSCSWTGPASPDTESALAEAADGRGGKGCPIFCATGNDYSARVGFPASSEFAIAVGASTDQLKRAAYSNRGAEVSVVAPSNGGTRGIFTSDVGYPARGYNTGNDSAGGADGLHTNSFGGTSSATPLAAGVAALVLSANPKLTREQVRDVLQDTADKIGPAQSYNNKGHSREFGYGQVNASRAVARAAALAQTPTPARKAAKKTVKKASKKAAKKTKQKKAA